MAELVALVHAVNPTDRGLSDAERDRRYALKARLQSRLLRDWPDHLELQLDEDTGVLAIEHRGHRRDAAHVPLSALDPDARALVRQRLSLPDEPDPDVPAAPLPRSPAGDALARGRRALDEWDYDGARAAFEEALAARGDDESAHALASLLVEHLAADEEALRLTWPARSARVAPLLALAAARVGDEARAAEHLGHARPKTGAAARLVLAERALGRGDLGAAASLLALTRDEDPASGELLRLEDALRRRREEGWAPLEGALAEAVAAGDDASIRAAAASLLAVAPAHPAARRSLAALDEAGRRAAGAQRLEEAGRLLDEGHLELALRALQRATSLDPALRDLVAELRARHDALAAARAVDSAVGSCLAGDFGPYLGLGSGDRAVVRDRVGGEDLARLEALEDAGARDPAAALRAWRAAEAELLAGRHLEASALLEGPVGALRPLRPLMAAIHGSREAALTEAARAGALAAVAGGRGAADVLARAAKVDRDRLDDALRAELDRAVADARASAQERADVAQFEAWVQQNPFHARALSEQRLRASPSDEGWRGRLERAAAEIRSVASWVEVEPWAPDLADAGLIYPQFSPDVCLEPGGAHVWLADARHWWCFLRRVEVATGRPDRVIVVRTAHPFTQPRVSCAGRRLLVGGAGGRVVSLARGDDDQVERVVGYIGEWIGMLGAPEYVDAGADPDRVLVRDIGRAPNHVQYAWWEVGSASMGLVVNVATSQLATDPAGRHGHVDHDHRTGFVTWNEHGAHPRRLGWAARMDGVASHPTGDELVFVGSFNLAEPPATVSVATLNPAARDPLRRRVLGTSRRPTRPIASCRRTGMVFVLMQPGPVPELVALDGALTERWRVPVPGLSQLLVAPDGRHAAAFVGTRSGCAIVPLGAEPPRVPDDAAPPEPVPVDVAPVEDAPSGLRVSALAPVTPADRATAAVRDAWTRATAATTPADRVAALADAAVWQAAEVQTTALRAAAAMEWADGPWARRLHAVAAWTDLWSRRHQNREGRSVGRLPGALDEGGLAALKDRALQWLQTTWEAGPAERTIR